MATWQHLRSSTANKRPTTSLADGRIAINTNTASPGLFFKDSAGTGIVKVGPVHVGTTAPNSVPAAGGSSGNYTGEQWLDTSVSPAQMKVWNGSTWVGIVADELPVSKLQDGAARQLIQTDAAGTGVEWTSDVDVPGTLDVTSTATFDSIAQHPLGTAGAPTITFTGDNNTGIYSPGADQVAISTGGSGRLFVDASGNVGVKGSTVITTSAASAPTFQVGDGNGSPAMVMYSSSTGQSQISFADTTTNTGSYDGYILYNQNSQYLALGTAASERLRITSAGLVGVGTSSPSALLTVSSGEARFDLNATNASGRLWNIYSGGGGNVGAGAFSIAEGGSTQRFVIVGGGSGEAMRIDASNRVGVGTTTPSATLHASGGSTVAILQRTGANACQINVGDSNLSNIYYDADAHIYRAGSGTERMRIDSSGRVGIGTSAPSNLLEVSSANNSYIRSTATGNSVSAIFGAYSSAVDVGSTTNHSLNFYTAGVNRATLDTSGRLGIGTTSPAGFQSGVLHVHGSTGSELHLTSGGSGTAASDGLTIEYRDSDTTGGVFVRENGALRFGTNDQERARLDSSGRLLVGTSSARSNFFNSTNTAPGVQVEGQGIRGSLSVVRNEPDVGGGFVALGKTRGSNTGDNTLVQAGDELGAVAFLGADGSELVLGALIAAQVDGTPGANDMPGRLVFSTTADGASSPTERMRISQDGLTSIAHATAGQVVVNAENTNASFTSTVIRPRTTRAAGTNCFYIYGEANSVNTFLVFNNGNVQNTNNSYAGISDLKLKENIVDAASQWTDIKSLQVRKYNFKQESGQQTHTQLGLIAQEVELVSPGLVSESPDRDAEGNDLGTVTKSVNYSVLYMKAVKALQEAMERIETLEAKVAALESA